MFQKLEHNNISFLLDVHSEYEQNRFETAFSKEPETIRWIEDFFTKDDVFLDIGANIGVYTLYAAVVHPDTSVYSCEPAYHNFYKLCGNIIKNDVALNVTPLSIGISDHVGYTRLHLSSMQDGSASHSLGDNEAQKRADKETFSHIIVLSSVDELVESGTINPPHHIKIDVDGVETLVVRGMKKYLLEPTLKSILIELDHKLADTKEIFDIMKTGGFTADHPINLMPGHSRERRTKAGHGHIENVIFSRHI